MSVITLNGNTMHTINTLPQTGTKAPDFNATKIDLSEICLNDLLGKKIILNIFPSLDTPTCAIAAKHFNEIATNHPDVLILCISVDLPFAQKRFCAAEQLKNIVPVSVFRQPAFGLSYGVLIKSKPLTGLLARAVVIIDESGTVIYSEQVSELSNEPNYPAILAALN